MAQSTANHSTRVRRVYSMYYQYNGKLEHSREYPSLKAFYEKCGKWCDEHPQDWQLCIQDIMELVQ